MAVLDYGDIIYMHASASPLKFVDVIYCFALRFITGAAYSTHHCTLYSLVGWTSLTQRRDFHMFIYKALIGGLPISISSLLAQSTITCNTRSSNWLLSKSPIIRTELGRSAFSAPFPHFKSLISTFLSSNCTCFLWSCPNPIIIPSFFYHRSSLRPQPIQAV